MQPHSQAMQYWSWSLPLVSIVAIPTVLITRALAQMYHPELYIDTLPTISKAAAFPPGSTVFAIGMTFASVCIVLGWGCYWVAGRWHIAAPHTPTSEQGWLQAAFGLATLLGIAAGLFLGGLSNISLEDNDPLHVLLSKLFFATQVTAFLIDTVILLRLRRHATPGMAPAHGGRLYLTPAIVLLSLAFLATFLFKGTGGFTDTMLMRRIYTGSELVVAICCLLYPLTVLPALRQYLSGTAIARATALTAEEAR